ncbi:MAG: hypothetical protein VX563_06195, partial [Planctomycetota bacterium]|nr:hypothetical protein [Planctomycetota bacterium]
MWAVVPVVAAAVLGWANAPADEEEPAPRGAHAVEDESEEEAEAPGGPPPAGAVEARRDPLARALASSTVGLSGGGGGAGPRGPPGGDALSRAVARSFTEGTDGRLVHLTNTAPRAPQGVGAPRPGGAAHGLLNRAPVGREAQPRRAVAPQAQAPREVVAAAHAYEPRQRDLALRAAHASGTQRAGDAQGANPLERDARWHRDEVQR